MCFYVRNADEAVSIPNSSNTIELFHIPKQIHIVERNWLISGNSGEISYEKIP